jgi:hypothetical protein
VASWTILQEQTVSISPRATAFTVICEQCMHLGETYPTVEGRLELTARHATLVCRRGHYVRVERALR